VNPAYSEANGKTSACELCLRLRLFCADFQETQWRRGVGARTDEVGGHDDRDGNPRTFRAYNYSNKACHEFGLSGQRFRRCCGASFRAADPGQDRTIVREVNGLAQRSRKFG
jgi:hypothetical protein